MGRIFRRAFKSEDNDCRRTKESRELIGWEERLLQLVLEARVLVYRAFEHAGRERRDAESVLPLQTQEALNICVAHLRHTLPGNHPQFKIANAPRRAECNRLFDVGRNFICNKTDAHKLSFANRIGINGLLEH